MGKQEKSEHYYRNRRHVCFVITGKE